MNNDFLLNQIISKVLGIDPGNVDENQKFIDMDIWDSMTFMIFISAIEENFKITLTNDEILELDCLKKTKEIINVKTS